MTPHSNNVLARAARAWCGNSLVFVASGLAAAWLLWAGIVWHSRIKQRDRQTAERMWKAPSDPPFDATHVFTLRGSQPGYATLTLRAGEQQSYQYGYGLTNLTLVVNASGVSVERSGSNLTVTFKP